MKRTLLITLPIAICIALFQPVSTFAKDDAQQDGGHEKGPARKEKAQGKNRGKSANREQVSDEPRNPSPSGRSRASASRPETVKQGKPSAARSRPSRAVPNQNVAASGANVNTTRSRAAAQSPGVAPSRSRYSRQPGGYAGQGRSGTTTVIDQRSYTRDNNYGGLWVHGDTHRDWDRNRVHSWNNHHYGWYEGGWLIIDSGYRPRGYYFSDYSGDSTVARVQRRLSAEGYPVGSADGVIGPATRNGIENYQSDHGLAVTGRINDPLLASLGLR